MSRPVQVADAVIFEAVFSVILAEGLDKLTFDRVAQKVGLVRTAIVNRFKNKHQLIVAADTYYLKQSDSAFESVVHHTANPIEAIIKGLCYEARFATSPAAYQNGLAMLAYGFRTPELYDNYQRTYLEQRENIVTLLERAKARGIIEEGADCRYVAELLQVVQQGALHAWIMTQNQTAPIAMEQQLREALKPYCRECR